MPVVADAVPCQVHPLVGRHAILLSVDTARQSDLDPGDARTTDRSDLFDWHHVFQQQRHATEIAMSIGGAT